MSSSMTGCSDMLPKGLPTYTFFWFLLLNTYKKSPPSFGWLSYKKFTPMARSLNTGVYLPGRNFMYFLCFSATLTGLFRIENVYYYFFYFSIKFTSACFYFSSFFSSFISVFDYSRLAFYFDIREGLLIMSRGNYASI